MCLEHFELDDCEKFMDNFVNSQLPFKPESVANILPTTVILKLPFEMVNFDDSIKVNQFYYKLRIQARNALQKSSSYSVAIELPTKIGMSLSEIMTYGLGSTLLIFLSLVFAAIVYCYCKNNCCRFSGRKSKYSKAYPVGKKHKNLDASAPTLPAKDAFNQALDKLKNHSGGQVSEHSVRSNTALVQKNTGENSVVSCGGDNLEPQPGIQNLENSRFSSQFYDARNTLPSRNVTGPSTYPHHTINEFDKLDQILHNKVQSNFNENLDLKRSSISSMNNMPLSPSMFPSRNQNLRVCF